MADGQEEKSIGTLFSDLTSQTATLVRHELQLAKVEMSQKAVQVGKDVGMIGLGGAIAHAGFLAVLAAVILALGEIMPFWLSALIVGLVALGAGYFMSQQRLNALKRLDPTPHATVASLNEDKEWAKEQLR